MSIDPGQWYILGALILAAPHLSPRSARSVVTSLREWAVIRQRIDAEGGK